ncbi:hypothetical protein S83_067898, partial [Arachis hypogaea]
VGIVFTSSLSRLADGKDNCYPEFMDECIYISSSDDDLEEIEDPKRSLPQWATAERNSDYGGRPRHDSFSRGASTSAKMDRIRELHVEKNLHIMHRMETQESSPWSRTYDKAYNRGPFMRGSDEDRFMHQNGVIRVLPPSLMHGKSVPPQYASSSEPAFRSGAGDERAPGSDERLIYEAIMEEFDDDKLHEETPLDQTQPLAFKFLKEAVNGAWLQSVFTSPPLVAQSSAFERLEYNFI